MSTSDHLHFQNSFFASAMPPTIWLIAALFAIAYFLYRRTIRKYLIIDEYFPGPKGYPFLGNALELMETSQAFYKKAIHYAHIYRTSFRLWVGPTPYLAIIDPDHAEAVMGSSVQIDKSNEYKFVVPWIGLGLLTSTGPKWKKHRKMLTPAFHFKILEKYVDVFNNNGNILCEKLSQEVDGKSFDIYEYIKLYALDNICETAMGLSIHAQKQPKSDYINAIRDICETSFLRSTNVLLRSDLLFALSKYSGIERRALKIIHGQTNEVIKTRKEELKKNNLSLSFNEDKEINVKQKLAFLDILLLLAEEHNLSDEDIRAEVDTFMFEGHDTITSGISFCLYLLATHPDVQNKVLEEQLKIFETDTRDPTYRDLQEMKFLEQVIKESLRLYPSVPYIGREMVEELKTKDGLIVPKGTQVYILLSEMQRNSRVWPNPNEFNPDNYSPDNLTKKHPYAATPFSAGPRNCIGQKFAMLEMKSAISKVIKHYKLIESPDPEDRPKITVSLIINSENGIKIKLAPRIYQANVL